MQNPRNPLPTPLVRPQPSVYYRFSPLKVMRNLGGAVADLKTSLSFIETNKTLRHFSKKKHSILYHM